MEAYFLVVLPCLIVLLCMWNIGKDATMRTMIIFLTKKIQIFRKLPHPSVPSVKVHTLQVFSSFQSFIASRLTSRTDVETNRCNL